jgi:hypothetical protein
MKSDSENNKSNCASSGYLNTAKKNPGNDAANNLGKEIVSLEETHKFRHLVSARKTERECSRIGRRNVSQQTKPSTYAELTMDFLLNSHRTI